MAFGRLCLTSTLLAVLAFEVVHGFVLLHMFMAANTYPLGFVGLVALILSLLALLLVLLLLLSIM